MNLRLILLEDLLHSLPEINSYPSDAFLEIGSTNSHKVTCILCKPVDYCNFNSSISYRYAGSGCLICRAPIKYWFPIARISDYSKDYESSVAINLVIDSLSPSEIYKSSRLIDLFIGILLRNRALKDESYDSRINDVSSFVMINQLFTILYPELPIDILL